MQPTANQPGSQAAGVLFPPIEAEERLTEALARVNEIGAAINRLSWDDPAGVEATLRLIAQSAVAMMPGSTAVLYTVDPRHGFDPVTRVSAGERMALMPGHQPRDDGMGMRAVQRLRPVLSYDEPDLQIHPEMRQAGVRVAACLPLVVADQPMGVLYVHLYEERRLSSMELLLLGNFVNQAAMAIYNAGQYTGVQRDLERKERELTRLRHAGLLLSSRSGLAETLEAILQMALEVTGARYGIFRLVDAEGDSLVTRAFAGEGLAQPALEALPINTTSVMGWAAKSRQPLLIHDVRAEPWSRIYYPLDHALEMRSELVVPLIGAGGRLEGVLNLESPVVGGFSEADSHLLQSLATQAVIAIQEARLLDALLEVAERLLVEPCEQVLDHLVGLTAGLLNSSASAIWTLDGEQLILRAASSGHARGDDLTLDGSLTGEAIRSRRPVTSDDVRIDPRFGYPELARSQGWTRALIVPLMAGSHGEPVGAFSVYGVESDPDLFVASDWDKKVLTILAHYAALAVRNAAAQRALRSAEEQRSAAETFAVMGDVAANLLHHLNNKVGTIPVRVEGIEDKCAAALSADRYLAQNLRDISTSAREAMRAVRANLAHLQSAPLGPVSLSACVGEALSQRTLPAEITLAVEGVDLLPAVRASQHGLALVFTNLLDNAIEAMHGRGHIVIAGSPRRGGVEVTVTDDGPGIPPEVQDRIFDLHYSGRPGASGKLGFGLWWVRTLLSRLGGVVAVESDGLRHTTFRVWLPCGDVEG